MTDSVDECCYTQIPLYRLPRDVRDKPVTSPLSEIPLRRLTRIFSVRGSFEVVGVVEFGLYRRRRRWRSFVVNGFVVR